MLPNTGMSFTPFDILTAAEMNELVENIEALSDGTGIATNAIEADKLDTNAILLGYAQITSNPSNFNSNSPVIITGLTGSVTIPAGGRKTEITVLIPYVQAGATLTCGVSIWDGTVGSGTKLAEQDYTIASGGYAAYTVVAVVQPSAGAKTYNAGIAVSTNAVTLNAGATYPAFILIKSL